MAAANQQCHIVPVRPEPNPTTSKTGSLHMYVYSAGRGLRAPWLQ